MKRASDAGRFDGAAHTEMGTEMGAERLLAGDGAAFGIAPEHQIGTEESAGHDRALGDLVGHGHLEPTEWHGKGKAAHRVTPSLPAGPLP